MDQTITDTPLHQYVEVNDTYYRIYERYHPDLDQIARVRRAQPHAHVVVASRYSCPDCARNLPRMARIAEHLPGWTWEVFDSGENPERRAALNITRIPTFIVYDSEGGRELGRIVENPVSGTLIADLLGIVGAG
ncbi:MAG TPA: thioredoxin family protein [Aggregatilineales bacterium]|nr:hypothetical protein [Chloroflexota bacterium]HOA23473.1 thioredoxin family protein [Aggregatilineales bacterium]HPV06259.1 thioredoxin family protein [Aggregatilineales bacterium]HQA68285.1 thioredoxin family protein [Aggregatilineales bacterium]HQE18143.1 thioredoxin family protein [Aggregatilineales bacterium]